MSILVGLLTNTHFLTHWSWDRMREILQITFWIAFSWIYASIGLDNGLAWNRWQVIMWSNDGIVYWCICITRPQWVNLVSHIGISELFALYDRWLPRLIPSHYLNQYSFTIELIQPYFNGNFMKLYDTTDCWWRYHLQLAMRELSWLIGPWEIWMKFSK